MSAAKKKVSAPSLVDRIEELEAEVETALDALAEERRPEGIPIGWIRQSMDNAAFGKNPFRAYIIAVKGE